LGELSITEKQAKKLEINPRTQMSRTLEEICLLLSGDESYEKAEKKIRKLTGISWLTHSVSHKDEV
jgi:hypothetical protein